MQPGIYCIWPGGYGEIGDAAEAVAVAALGVEVELRGDVDGLEREEVCGGVFYVDCVVFGLNDDCGRGLGVGMDVELVEEGVFGVGEIAGIDDYGEVGTAAELVGSVDGGVEALIVVSAEGGDEVASGGEAEDAYAFGVDVPFSGVLADDADGALGVFKGGRGFGEVGAGIRDAVLEQDAIDSDPVEPVADFGAFEVDGEDRVSAAGEDDYGCAGVSALGRVEGDGWAWRRWPRS